MDGNTPIRMQEDLVKKVPTFEEYKKDNKSAVSYIFMIIFFVYFIYSEFMRNDSCSEKIASFEKVIIQKDVMITQLNDRVQKLENAIDVKNGIIKEVKEVVKVNDPMTGGGK